MKQKSFQPPLPIEELQEPVIHKGIPNATRNYLHSGDEAVHDWYRFVLAFPPHLVRAYIRKFNVVSQQVILDPFCGTGTTLIEAKLNDIASVGTEANPVAHFVSKTKLNWSIDFSEFEEEATAVAETVLNELESQGIGDKPTKFEAPPEIELLKPPESARKLLISNSISPLPLHKTLVLQKRIEQRLAGTPFYDHALLALAKVLVFSISNLRFGPEVGIGKIKTDAAVVAPWLAEIRAIAGDIKVVGASHHAESSVFLADARTIGGLLEPLSIDAVITSPPYPNEKDYSRTTRLESVMLGFMTSTKEMRAIKKSLIRSNTRGVYKADMDDKWIEDDKDIVELANTIEQRRIELGKTSGFEKLYARVTLLYFGGMARHLSELKNVLKPGARLAYVVGDQASYFQVMIRTGQHLARIAERLGYEVEEIDLFRTRLSTATGEQLREEVVVLRWPDGKG